MTARFRSDFLLVILAVALVIVVGLVLRPASASATRAHGSAKLVAPVIKETFTPLPCSGGKGGGSTLQMEGCAEQQILRSDTQIDTLNASIFGKLPTTSAKKQFIVGHDAWLTYRHQFCLSYSDVAQGGTLQPVLFAQCEVSVNAAHVSGLKTFLKALAP